MDVCVCVCNIRKCVCVYEYVREPHPYTLLLCEVSNAGGDDDASKYDPVSDDNQEFSCTTL
jgi:hypothetical protein